MGERVSTKGMNAILFSVLAVLSLTVFIYSMILLFVPGNGNSDRQMSAADSLMLENFISGEAGETKDALKFMEQLKPLSPLMDLIRDYETELQNEYNAMKSDLAGYDMEAILSTSIDYPDSIRVASEKLTIISSKLSKHKAKFREVSGKTALKLKNLVLKGLKNRAPLDSIYLLIIDGDYNINQYFSIQESMLGLVSKLQKFLTDKKGNYRLVGEEVKFQKAKDQAVFTDFGNKLLDLWQKEKEWLMMIKQQEGIVDEKIHTEIENCL